MNPLKRGRTRLAIAALGALGALAIFAGVASALTGTATLTAGTLQITSPTQLTFSGPLTVAATYFSDVTNQLKVDNPGGTSGWSVTAWNTPFTCSTSATCGSSTLTDLVFNGDTATSPTDSAAPSLACTVAGCTNPTPSGVTFPVTVSQAATAPGSPSKVYNATAGTGVGGIWVKNAWWVDAPANTLEGTYTSTITLAINATP